MLAEMAATSAPKTPDAGHCLPRGARFDGFAAGRAGGYWVERGARARRARREGGRPGRNRPAPGFVAGCAPGGSLP